MQNMIPFQFQSNPVRVVDVEGEPWFVAKDVAEVLGYSNPLKAVRDHCKGVNETFTPTAGGYQAIKIIPERDVYRLVMRSRLPQAERFEEWVVGEVLPAIRRTGRYGVPDVASLSRYDILKMALESEEERLRLERQAQEDAPKVAFHDRVTEAKGEHTIDQAAKMLGTGQRRLFQLLRERNILRRDNLPYQQYVDRSLFRVAEKPFKDANGRERLSAKTVVTGRGLVFLQQMLASGSPQGQLRV